MKINVDFTLNGFFTAPERVSTLFCPLGVPAVPFNRPWTATQTRAGDRLGLWSETLGLRRLTDASRTAAALPA